MSNIAYRYVNMDYFCLATLEHNIPSALVISYNIVCQWSVNFVARCLKYPPNAVGSNPVMDIKYLVPKFHLLVIRPCSFARLCTLFSQY